MKKLLILLAFSLFASSAFATPTVCESGSLATYLTAGFSCDSGALVFSGFSYSANGSIQPSSSLVAVTPSNSPDEVGFEFVGPWSVASNRTSGDSQFEESQVQYTVQRTSGLIDSIRLAFGSTVTGSGTANVSESFCLNGDVNSCPDSSRHGLKVSNPGVGFSDVAFFAGVNTISVSESIRVASNGNGTASITGITNTFSSPEPLSFVLLGTGLLGIGLMRKRLGRR